MCGNMRAGKCEEEMYTVVYLFVCLFVCLFEEKKDRPSKDAFSKVPSKLRIVGQFLFSGQNERCKGES